MGPAQASLLFSLRTGPYGPLWGPLVGPARQTDTRTHVTLLIYKHGGGERSQTETVTDNEDTENSSQGTPMSQLSKLSPELEEKIAHFF